MDLELLDIPAGKVTQFNKSEIYSLEDLVARYPRKYIDFRTIAVFDRLSQFCGTPVVAAGQVVLVEVRETWMRVTITDDTGGTLPIMFFNQSYLSTFFKLYRKYAFFGQIEFSEKYGYTMIAPHSYIACDTPPAKIIPIYRKIRGMSTEYFEDCLKKALSILTYSSQYGDDVPKDLLRELNLPLKKDFLQLVHYPEDENDILLAEKRKTFDLLFPFICKLEEKNRSAQKESFVRLTDTNVLLQFLKSLPFELTNGQSGAINDVLSIIKSNRRCDALVRGDVGCGKTMVAVALALVMASNQYQSAIMCPTTVLARQHYDKIKDSLEPFGVNVCLLVSGTPAKEKRDILADVKSGKAQVIVGTHAVLSKDVEFQSLGLTVVDEEHRFGVEQRALLKQKAAEGVHHVSMTATPIPRTIAETIYGENTQILNIEDMPNGRKPINTVIFSNREKVFAGLYRQIQAGHQCYIVCPLIDEDENSKNNENSVEFVLKDAEKYFAQYSNVKINAISGKMKQKEIDAKIGEFSAGQCSILISTTIVEVGVDVPNATVIAIMGANNFGLAQLHQLRGRVGRGSVQSFCVLMTTDKENARLQVMAKENNGFVIAQKDLELRGTGNLVGTKQSGFDTCVELMISNPKFYKQIKEATLARWDSLKK